MPFQVSSGLTFSKMTYLIGMLISGPPQHEHADTEAAAEPAVSGARGETTRFETRPTVAAPAESSTQARILDFQVFDDLEGFTFPVRAPPTTAPAAPRATEMPRSQPQPAQAQSQVQNT